MMCEMAVRRGKIVTNPRVGRACSAGQKRPRRSPPVDPERNRIERLINRLKQLRAIATRAEKLQAAHAALITIAGLRRWL